MNKNNSYDLKTVKAPVLRGQALRIFVALLEGPLGKLIIPKLLADVGVKKFKETVVETPPDPKTDLFYRAVGDTG